MSIYALKPKFQALLRPLAARLHSAGVTANQVTMLACIVSVALGAALVLAGHDARLYLLIPVWFLLRMALNAVDGMLAREHGQASRLGAYLNELADVVSDAALYAPFALLPGSNPWLIAGIVALAIVSEMAGVLGAAVGATRRYDGPMGKSDRALVFSATALLVGLGVPLDKTLDWIWGTILVLLAVTIVNRIRRGLAAAI